MIKRGWTEPGTDSEAFNLEIRGYLYLRWLRKLSDKILEGGNCLIYF